MLRYIVWAILLSGGSLCAQPIWERTIETTAGSGAVANSTDAGEGRTVLLFTQRDQPPFSRMMELDEAGEVINVGEFSFPGTSAYGNWIVGQSLENEWIVIGLSYHQISGLGDSCHVLFIKVDEEMQQLTATSGGTPGKQIAYMAATIAADNTIRVAYQTWVNDEESQQFHGVTFDLEGNELATTMLLDVPAFPSIGSLHMLPNGNMVLGTTSTNWGTENAPGGFAVELNNAWEFQNAYPFPRVDPTNELFLNSPRWPFYVLPLPSGNLIASGHYWKSFSEDRGAVVQHTNAQAVVIHQWTAESPYLQEIPANFGALDMNANGELFYAQMNNWNVQGVDGTLPSQVDVFKLDTSLNVLATYRFDGFEDNAYYYPAHVSATPDGGVIISGAKVDLNTPGAVPQGWIARFGPDGLVGVNEQQRPKAHLFPNPGTHGFNIMLGQPLSKGRLELHDAQGRHVLTETFSGIQGFIGTPHMAPGLYAVTLRDAQGAVVEQLRWLKE